jgi:PAS domain S-box-containing protein
MADDMKCTTSAAALRREAEAKVATQPASAVPQNETDAKRLLHELQVHQVELEMQNEEQRRTLLDLAEHKTHLENVIKNTPAGYFHIDLEGCFLEVNNAWLRMHGYDSSDEVVGKHFSMMQVDSESDSALAHLAELQRGVPIPYGEFSSRRKDGSVGHHIFSAHPVVHVGKIAGFEWFIIDISERRKIEEVQSYLLQISSIDHGEDFFESLARYLAKILGMDYVCIDRLQGDCLSAKTLAVYHDGKFEDNVEYTLKDTPCGDVVGKEVCVFPREVRNLFPQDAALQDLQAESYVGTTLWSFEMKPIGLIAVIGRKELNSSRFAETVLKLVSIRAAGELERRQVEEDKLLLLQQFQQAQRLESLGVLAGGIAHDFNNILAIILGYCGLTRMDYEKAEHNITEIEKAVERAAALCRQMLAYAGKATLSQAPVVMWVLVDEVATMLKATIRQNVVIKTCYSPDLPSIIGDASQLRQIVMNLIINASEAIGESQGEVCVSLSKALIKAGLAEKDYNGKTIPPGEYVYMEVTDSGCGMDDETRRRIFEPFYTTKFTGRGLGMSAVLGIITMHKGALQLSSQSGHGTTFKVYLPAQIGTANEEEAQKTASAPWKGSGTILLAEDEEQVSMILKAMLEALGFKVIGAADGKEALDLYKKYSADITLVIADMGMPVMDGYELFRELKMLNSELPIIVSSGFGDAEVTSRIPREQIAGLVNKPYHYDQLREMLKGVLG